MAKSRPYRVRDPAGKAHTFATLKRANEFKQGNPGSRITLRPLRILGHDKRLRSLASQYQVVLRNKGTPKTLKQLAADKDFRQLVRDLKKAKTANERYQILAKITGRKYTPGTRTAAHYGSK